ncbi:hypothetical protein ACF1BQ_016095 [Bradyrhizobium sp. RDT10]
MTEKSKAQQSLERIQSFDAESISRDQDLGTALNFRDAVEPAKKVIGLFQQFPSEYVFDLPTNKQEQLKSQADAFYNHLDQIVNFDPKQDNAYGARTSLISSIKDQYDSHFNFLSPLIAYGASRIRDYRALEREARAAMQAASDRADEATKSLESNQKEAERILAEVRKVAAEQGVSQQAIYFQTEGSNHDANATSWRNATICTAIGLATYAALTATMHKWAWLAPNSTYESVQLGLSKVLIFAVIAYMLILCARNFLAHRHNSIVNRHRQNALLTFNALASAAKGEEQKDIVLTYAAACIFAPQDTGFTKSASGQPEIPTNIIQAAPKIMPGSS